ncbi:MAG TPA: ABC transporter permease [Ktedonobacteraceae bacterium]|nr:ABC transporter permease [Ktedonobacteraceae bacterium]
MIQFFVKRLIGLVFVIICVTFITFILGYFAPGDPIKVMMGEHFDPRLYASLRHQYGLDLPWYQQYYNFLVNLVHLDFGYSFHEQGRLVWDILYEGVGPSAELGAWGLLLTVVIGVPIGIFSAIKANTWLDTLAMGMSLVLFALPTFILAVYSQVAIVWFDKLTGAGWPVSNWGVPWQYNWEDIQFKLIPILVYAAVGFAYYARLTRTSMLEVLRQDYVRTARAKGLRERAVVYRHAFRNALIPLVTVLGLSIGTLVTGIFFIEQIFNIPGIGQTALTAITDRDYPVIQATVILGALAVVVGNLLSDIFYSIVDPRIKAE